MRALARCKNEVTTFVERPQTNAVLGVERLQSHGDNGLRRGNSIVVRWGVRAEPTALFGYDHGVLRKHDEDELVQRLQVCSIGFVDVVVDFVVDGWEEGVSFKV